jgi:hypothetical protein
VDRTECRFIEGRRQPNCNHPSQFAIQIFGESAASRTVWLLAVAAISPFATTVPGFLRQSASMAQRMASVQVISGTGTKHRLVHLVDLMKGAMIKDQDTVREK